MNFNKRSPRSSLIFAIALIIFMGLNITIPSQSGATPFVAINYALEKDGKVIGVFPSVNGVGSVSEVVEHTVIDQSTGKSVTTKYPGRFTCNNIILSRLLTSNLDVWQWRQLVVDGKISEAQSPFSIVAYSQLNRELVRWNFSTGWPVKIIYEWDNDHESVLETLILTCSEGSRCPDSQPCSPIQDFLSDYDNDGDVDGKELSIFAPAYNSTSADENYNVNADLDKDEDVDKDDVFIFTNEYGTVNYGSVGSP